MNFAFSPGDLVYVDDNTEVAREVAGVVPWKQGPHYNVRFRFKRFNSLVLISEGRLRPASGKGEGKDEAPDGYSTSHDRASATTEEIRRYLKRPLPRGRFPVRSV